VRQREDHAFAPLKARGDVFSTHQAIPERIGDRARVHGRQPERLQPVTGVRAQRRADEFVHLEFRQVRPDDAAQVLAQLPNPGTVANGGGVGRGLESAGAERPRHALH
jgi:hypothetical protein